MGTIADITPENARAKANERIKRDLLADSANERCTICRVVNVTDRVITIPRNPDGSVQVLEADPLWVAGLPESEKPFPTVRIKVMIGPQKYAILMPVSDSMREDPSFEKMLTAYAQCFNFDAVPAVRCRCYPTLHD